VLTNVTGDYLRSLINDFQRVQHRELLYGNQGKFEFALTVRFHAMKGLDKRPLGTAGEGEDVEVPRQGDSVQEDVEKAGSGAPPPGRFGPNQRSAQLACNLQGAYVNQIPNFGSRQKRAQFIGKDLFGRIHTNTV